MNTIKPILSIFIICVVTSCVSRLARPQLTGTISDFDGNPIENCKVGEATTNEIGEFELQEVRYNQFFLTELFKMEAPPLFIYETVEKDGYLTKDIYQFEIFGGGKRKGATLKLDTIYLKKENQSLYPISNINWLSSVNPSKGLIYMFKPNYNKLCLSQTCKKIYYEFSENGSDYQKEENANLPEGVLRNFYRVLFNDDQTMDITSIVQYGNKDGSWREKQPNDTIYISGTWELNSMQLLLNSEDEAFNGKFTISEFDFPYLKLQKH